VLEGKLVEALMEAERACRKLLEKALGSKASHINVVLRLDVLEGIKTLVVEVEASRSSFSDIDYVVEVALEEAFRVFEEVSGLKVVKGGK